MLKQEVFAWFLPGGRLGFRDQICGAWTEGLVSVWQSSAHIRLEKLGGRERNPFFAGEKYHWCYIFVKTARKDVKRVQLPLEPVLTPRGDTGENEDDDEEGEEDESSDDSSEGDLFDDEESEEESQVSFEGASWPVEVENGSDSDGS